MADLPPQKTKIIVLDDEVITVRRLVQALQRDGYQVEGFVSASEAMARVQKEPPHVMIMDVRLKDADGVELMQRLQAVSPQTRVILITGYATIDHAVNATKKGAFNYLAKPFRLESLRAAVRDALRHIARASQKERLAEELSKTQRFGEMIGSSEAMRKVFATIAQVAPVDCSVLVSGESGTGKELVARSLHANSPRSRKPFVSFNCGSFSEELIANELFGHEKGAFTGAVSTKLGLLETANGGTLFLDEIGEMPLSMQVKLLRVIQEHTFLRIGGVEPRSLDVRLIAATNRDLEKMIAAGTFRQDLYYRLKVVTIDLPPLRKRRDDIPALAAHFAATSAQRFGKPMPTVSNAFLDALAAYPFPGNVRELEHIVERAVALSQGVVLEAADLPPDLFLADAHTEEADQGPPPLKDLEKEHIFEVYRSTGFNQSETARLLGISRTTLWRRLRQFDLLAPKGRKKA